MLWADYGFHPHSQRDAYFYTKNKTEEVRHFQLIGHEVSDYVYRMRYLLPFQTGQKAKTITPLAELSGHEKWWLRLYVAQIMLNNRELRQPETIQRLKK